jgi:hypothetical protein
VNGKHRSPTRFDDKSTTKPIRGVVARWRSIRQFRTHFEIAVAQSFFRNSLRFHLLRVISSEPTQPWHGLADLIVILSLDYQQFHVCRG